MNEKCAKFGKKEDLPKSAGLPELVKMTCSHLEARVRAAFVGQQAIDIGAKDKLAVEIVEGYSLKEGRLGVGLFKPKMEKAITAMLVELAQLWDFPRTSRGIATSWAMYSGLERLWTSVTAFFFPNAVKTCIASPVRHFMASFGHWPTSPPITWLQNTRVSPPRVILRLQRLQLLLPRTQPPKRKDWWITWWKTLCS